MQREERLALVIVGDNLSCGESVSNMFRCELSSHVEVTKVSNPASSRNIICICGHGDVDGHARQGLDLLLLRGVISDEVTHPRAPDRDGLTHALGEEDISSTIEHAQEPFSCDRVTWERP